MRKKRRFTGLVLIMLSFMIVGVSAYVYESATSQVTQTIKQIATLTVDNAALGDLEEGETKTYTETEVPELGDIINVTTTKDTVYLHLDSDINDLSSYYDTYNIVVKFAAVGSGSTHAVDDVACTLTLVAPDDTVTLDKLGNWLFNFEITTTAKSVSEDQATIVEIIVTAEST